MNELPNPEWLQRLTRTWPTDWNRTRRAAYLDALHGADDRHITATITALIRGGWTGQYAPNPAVLRGFVNDTARQEQRDRREAADTATEHQHHVAPPWHALLWWAVLTSLQGQPPHTIPTRLQPYRAIADKHALTPHDAGVRWTTDAPHGGRHFLTTRPNLRLDKVDHALTEAEAVWRATGTDTTAANAAIRAMTQGHQEAA